MKYEPFAVTPRWSYRLDSFPSSEISDFVRQADCPACGTHDRWRVVARIGGTSSDKALGLVCCLECGHVTYDRLPTEAWLTKYYGQVWDRARRKEAPTQVKLTAPAFPPWGFPWAHFQSLKLPFTARILDFGCGFGNGLLHMKELGYQNAWGVELGSHRIAVAQHNFPGRVFEGSAERATELAARGGKFDAIVLHHVTEHLRDPFKTISTLRGLLSPQGVLVLAVPEIMSESPLLLSMYLPHLHHFNTGSLVRMLGRAGLRAFRWRGSRPQLAVVATADPRWTPPADYSSESPPAGPEIVEEVRRYVGGPWVDGSARGLGDKLFVCHVNPAYRPDVPTGAQALNPAVSLWLMLGQATVFRLINRSDARRGYQAFLRLGRRLFGANAPVGTETLGFKRLADASDPVPWFTLPNGDVPVLVK